MLRMLLVGLAAVLSPRHAVAQAPHETQVRQPSCRTLSRDALVRGAQLSAAFQESVRAIRRFHERLAEAPDSGDVERFCRSMRVHTVNVLGTDRHLVYFAAHQQMATTYAWLGVTEAGDVYFLNPVLDGAIEVGMGRAAWNAFLAAGGGSQRLEDPVSAMRYGCLLDSIVVDGVPIDRCAVETRAEVTRRDGGWEVRLGTLGLRLLFTDRGIVEALEELKPC